MLRKIPLAAAAAALLVSGSAALLHGAANAHVQETSRIKQKSSRDRSACPIQAAEGQRQYRLSAAECEALTPVIQAVGASDWAAAQAALPAAQAAAASGDARLIVAQAMLQVGVQTNNAALQSQAIDQMIDSGAVDNATLGRLLSTQYDLAVQARDLAKAERALTRLQQLNPNDPELLIRQAVLRSQNNDAAGALQIYRRAIRERETARQPVPEDWRKRALATAYNAQMRAESVTLARELVAAHPTQENWRDLLVIYRDFGNADPSVHLDLYRLMRAAGAMAGEREYIEYAEAADRLAAWGEVKAVLEEGLSRNLLAGSAAYARERLATTDRRIAEDRGSLDSQRAAALAASDGRQALRLAEAYFGYGQYADAAALYRAALEKGQDASLVNLRLGGALALAGRRAEAETALRAVTGPRADLAALWLLWLSSRG